jgi:GNAT superfamily N-acetyltransferase
MSGQFLLDIPEDDPVEPVAGVVLVEPVEPVEPVELLEPVAELPLVDPELVLGVVVAALATSAPPVIKPLVRAPTATTLRRRRIFMVIAPLSVYAPPDWRNIATLRPRPVVLSRRTSSRDRSPPRPCARLRWMPIAIRAAAPDDGPALQEIERQAGARFRDVGMESIADAEPASVDTLTTYAVAGRSWVALDTPDRPIGYVIADLVDGNAHIEQISVRPDHQGRGVGRALIERVQKWAAQVGSPAITLSTFLTVPWNGPLYAHLGFAAIPDDELGPELRAVRESETRHGLDPAARICMRLEVPGRTGN